MKIQEAHKILKGLAGNRACSIRAELMSYSTGSESIEVSAWVEDGAGWTDNFESFEDALTAIAAKLEKPSPFSRGKSIEVELSVDKNRADRERAMGYDSFRRGVDYDVGQTTDWQAGWLMAEKLDGDR